MHKLPCYSHDSYREFIVPEVRKCSRRLREAGIYSVNATDGDIWSVIDAFLFGCEVDAYLEINRSAGMDLGKLKTLYGDKILLFGNMDCGSNLSFETPDEIRKITFETLDAGWGQGGHIFIVLNSCTNLPAPISETDCILIIPFTIHNPLKTRIHRYRDYYLYYSYAGQNCCY